QSLGLSEAVIPRAILLDNSRAVVAAVRGGQAVVGVVYGSDVMNAADCRLVFRVPRGQACIQYRGAVVNRGPQPAKPQARALLDFLSSRQAISRFRRCGFLPVRKRPA